MSDLLFHDHLRPAPSQSLYDAVKEKLVGTLGQNFTETDLARFYNFANTQQPEHIFFLVAFHAFMVDAGEFQIPSSFFGKVAAFDPRLQSLRLTLCCAMVASADDAETDCKEYRIPLHMIFTDKCCC